MNRLAMPTDTMLAEAPIMVRFPPKHAPRANAHQRILLGMGVDSSISRTMGIMVMVNGMLSRKPDTIPDTHSTINTMTYGLSAHPHEDMSGDPLDDPLFFQYAHQNEEAGKKEQGAPLDLLQHLFHIHFRDGKKNHCHEHGHHTWREFGDGLGDKKHDGQNEACQAFDQKQPVNFDIQVIVPDFFQEQLD